MSGDEEFGHLLPVLRRITILVAVITAIPVVLWTITAFVRTYVSPPKIPTYHQLAATASINAPSDPGTKENANSAPQVTAEETKSSPPLSVSVEARATPTDARDAGTAPKGPFLGDRPPDSTAQAASPTTSPPAANALTVNATAPSAPAMSAPKMPDTASATTPATKPTDTEMPAASAAADSAPTSIAAAAQPTAMVAVADATSAMPATEPLSGPVPLPRHRPHIVAASEPAAAGTTRMAAAAAGPIPVPRPRPESAGPGAPADDSSGGPLGFIQNLFGGKQ